MRGPETLKSFLAANHAPCPSCGYDLHGVPGRKCPECAMPLDLEIVKVGPVRVSQPSETDVPHRQPTKEEIIIFLLLAACAVAMIVLALMP